jgi:hypothetical protein
VAPGTSSAAHPEIAKLDLNPVPDTRLSKCICSALSAVARFTNCGGADPNRISALGLVTLTTKPVAGRGFGVLDRRPGAVYAGSVVPDQPGGATLWARWLR